MTFTLKYLNFILFICCLIHNFTYKLVVQSELLQKNVDKNKLECLEYYKNTAQEILDTSYVLFKEVKKTVR